jgi:hypothetical protein
MLSSAAQSQLRSLSEVGRCMPLTSEFMWLDAAGSAATPEPKTPAPHEARRAPMRGFPRSSHDIPLYPGLSRFPPGPSVR